MNEELVDDLMWRSGVTKVTHHDPKFPEFCGWIVNQEVVDRLIEMTVRECGYEIGKFMDYTSYDDPEHQAIELKAQREARRAILERFGLK
jgi:hypothetical protein